MDLRKLMLSGLVSGIVVSVNAPWALADGDFDGDGDVDLADYAEFPGCMGGPGVGFAAGCEAFDFDLDTDVDAGDFAGFQLAFGASAGIVIETVTIGNPGNAGEQSRLASGDPTFYGAVPYTFSMGKYEVTAGQYTAFLNAVAATDTYGLYHIRMDYDADPTRNGCNIKRHGAPGSYTYSVAPDWANRPVNWVSWADAVRFANWLHNGQPKGAQDLTTTEDGSYFINGIGQGNDTQLEDVLREPDATWVVPTDNEWYKAAYHKNDGVTGNYWNYGTSSDFFPDNDLIDPDPGNNATFHEGVFGDPEGYTIGSPYYRTEGGAHENSSSAYGTFDQAGNMMEFTETVPESDIRRMRDGSWKLNSGLMGSSQIDDVMHSSDQFDDLGFRVARVQ